jgi:hypothetical protein
LSYTIKPSIDYSIYALENIVEPYNTDEEEQYGGYEAMCGVCIYLIGRLIRVFGCILYKCVAWACLGILIVYIFLLWLPLDILFQGLNKFGRSTQQ